MNITLWKIGLALVVSVLVLFLGVAVAIAPIYIAVFSVIPIFLVIAFTQFRIGVLIVLFFATGIIPSQLTPKFSLGGGDVQVEELLFGILLIVCLIRMALNKNHFINNSVYYPIYFFFLLSILATLIGIGNQNKYNFILIDLRTVFYWLYAFLLAISIQNEKELNSAIKILIILSTILSTVVILQSLLGIQLLSRGRLTGLHTLDKTVGVSRSQFGGLISLAVFAFILTLTRVARKEMPTLIGLLCSSILGLSIVLSFGRGIWAAAFLSVLTASIWLGFRSFVRIWAVLMTLGITSTLIALIVTPEYVDAAVSRIFSVRQEVSEGRSYEWRKLENAHAIQTIKEHPVFGVGIGGEYKRPERNYKFVEMGEQETFMMHNSWLWLMFKFGIIGIVFPIWLTIAVFYKARKLNTSLSIASASALLTPIVAGGTQMEWATRFGILCIATMVGFLIANSNVAQK